jgi:outer membrane biosynthesis protein TonB
MTGAVTSNDVLSRVRREQRRRGKDSSFSGLRIVLMATAITVAILLFAFGAIGMLIMARSPQEPIASRLDPSPPLVQQVQEPVQSQPQPEVQAAEPDAKTVKTLRVVAPTPPPEAEPLQKNEAAAQQPPATEPETTATIPPSPNPQTQQPQVPQRAVQQRQAPQHAVRRPVPEPQSDNPLFQLFGIKKYR